MKIQKLIIYTFFLLSVSLFSQKKISSGEINYEITMEVDENKLRKVSKKLKGSDYAKESAISILKNQGKTNFKLLFNTNESVFKEDESLKINDKKINLVKILIGKGLFYTKKSSKKIINKEESFGEVFLIEVPYLKWVLTQESKKIGKYLCYKATTEKEGENKKGKFVNKITAWYTSELPINFAPKDYFGLPGLILELKEGNLLFKVSKIKLNLKEKIVLKEPVKGKKVTLEEYNKIVKEIVTRHRRY
tara:strand:+ start:307 stop:1050 length:744 start_codon:yes stop_codon:yes gene_type:complete